MPALLSSNSLTAAQSACGAACGSTGGGSRLIWLSPARLMFQASPAMAVLPRCQPARSSRLSERRSEEHTSELQSRGHLVCRLLLEKKKCTYDIINTSILT